MAPAIRRLLVALLLAAPTASAVTVVRASNPHGSLTIRVKPVLELIVHKLAHGREALPDDVKTDIRLGFVEVVVQPRDGARVDLTLDVPYGLEIEVATESGAVDFEGIVDRATITTVSGDVRISTPWRITALDYEASVKGPSRLDMFDPKEFRTKKRTIRRKLDRSRRIDRLRL